MAHPDSEIMQAPRLRTSTTGTEEITLVKRLELLATISSGLLASGQYTSRVDDKPAVERVAKHALAVLNQLEKQLVASVSEQKPAA